MDEIGIKNEKKGNEEKKKDFFKILLSLEQKRHQERQRICSFL